MGVESTQDDTPPMTVQNAEAVVEALADAANTGVDTDALVNSVSAEHNYLQREMFFSILKPAIIALASEEMVDPRNERAVEVCREIVDAQDWDLLEGRRR